MIKELIDTLDIIDFDKPKIVLRKNGFIAYCKKKDMPFVMNILRGAE
jgi:hypothetical protein